MPALFSRMMLPSAVLRWRRSVRTKPLGTPPIPSVPSGPRRCAASPRSRSPSSPQRLSAGIVRKRMIVCYHFTNINPTLVNISTHSCIANLTFSPINHQLPFCLQVHSQFFILDIYGTQGKSIINCFQKSSS